MGNLATPKSVQKLQTALHAKAKAEAGYRFYALYDKISRDDILAHAYAQCRSNKGAPGIDGQDFADIEAYGVERWLAELALALRQETYRPEPIRRVFIPKANGKLRPLGISSVRDRVCMTAALLVLEPIFEADLPSEIYAYRAARNAQQAVVEVEELVFRGHPDVVDADLARRGSAENALHHLRQIMGKLKLTVNEEKTRICRVPDGEFAFLGYTFGRMYSPETGKARLGYRPSKKSIKRIVEEVPRADRPSEYLGLLPARVDTADPSQPIYLDWAARETPSIALTGAAREALRMVDVFEAMLRGALDALNRGDRKRVTETTRMDKVLDRLDTAIKEYLTSLDSDALDDIDHRRLSEILAFTTNLEHAGDIVEKSLMPLAAKRIRRGVSFSEAAREEIREMIDRLISNARAAAAVFITEDPRAARQLLGEKEVFREIETRTTEEYFGRARTTRAENIEMGKLLLDIVRDLKRVNAHLAAAAYPVLEGRGELLSSRLKQD